MSAEHSHHSRPSAPPTTTAGAAAATIRHRKRTVLRRENLSGFANATAIKMDLLWSIGSASNRVEPRRKADKAAAPKRIHRRNTRLPAGENDEPTTLLHSSYYAVVQIPSSCVPHFLSIDLSSIDTVYLHYRVVVKTWLFSHSASRLNTNSSSFWIDSRNEVSPNPTRK